MGEMQGGGEGGNETKKRASLAEIRFGNGASPDGDGLSMISPDFEEDHGQSLYLQYGPFFAR